ncbi:unnamed protein product [Paramecium sonneborni]|uniref:Uncharacterized protein n=1 Tax=Paramecium sonneborni TaxID=65129 RepID=A0A8S1NXT2_9CILI|nr:unnamed protein product [Paramecium sonneborni]
MRFQSKSQKQNSEDKQTFKQNEFSDLDSDFKENRKVKSTKPKKIKKQQPKSKSGNWGSGRPSKNKKTIADNQQNQQLTEEALQNLWFGRDISMKIIIYLCKMGNMIFKVVTGIPASKIKKGFMKVDSYTHQDKKKYSNQLKKDLKNKYSQILQYLDYPIETTYLFLGQNNNYNNKLYLNNIPEETKNGLEIVMKYLSPKFIDTYKLIVKEFFQNQKDVYQNTFIDNIVQQLIENYQDHKMIFDRQLIFELTKDDCILINEIESDPLQAQIHLYQNSSLRNLNFFSNTFNDEVDEIKKNSNWIRQFIQGFIEILQICCSKALSE